MPRPSVDVVVPFLGSEDALARLRRRLGTLCLRDGDSVVVVDNAPEAEPAPDGPVPVLWAGQRPTPAFARNAGAARGSADWLVFCDADTSAPADLLDRYFEPLPAERTGLIGGGVVDEPQGSEAGIVARYGQLRGLMDQEGTFDFGDRWGYPKTANVACRREAFESVGGFREEIRAAEDADLTYRLRDQGWELERREGAAVIHSSRTTLRGLVVQQALWGAGGAWVAKRYPGSVPLVNQAGLLRWALSTTLGGFAKAIRERSRDAAIMAVMRPVEALAWEFGRRALSNERKPR